MSFYHGKTWHPATITRLTGAHISYHRARPSLPGITVTRSGHGLADGYLTASSARRFGAALRRQFLADHARAATAPTACSPAGDEATAWDHRQQNTAA